jgi:glutathione S-transferase
MLLIIGNKNYSSWSFRPWIAMKVAGITFEERVISLNDSDFKRAIASVSKNGRVPAIDDDGVHVWESLAVLEYLAEKFPQAKLWPTDVRARAHARAIAAEMHAGFAALRGECPMNFWRPVKRRDLSADALADAARIDAMWSECLVRYGGPFLFGAFGAVDAMYAPVVSRFYTYAVEVGKSSRVYMEAVMALPAWGEWNEAALKEPWVLPYDEPDWPTVLRVGSD